MKKTTPSNPGRARSGLSSAVPFDPYAPEALRQFNEDWGGDCPGADVRPPITDAHDTWFADRPVIGPDATHAQRYGELAAFKNAA